MENIIVQIRKKAVEYGFIVLGFLALILFSQKLAFFTKQEEYLLLAVFFLSAAIAKFARTTRLKKAHEKYNKIISGVIIGLLCVTGLLNIMGYFIVK